MIEIIAIIIFIWALYSVFFKSPHEVFFDKIFMSMMSFCVILSLAGFIGLCTMIFVPPIEIKRDNLQGNIYSLKSNSEIQGNFILGSGEINSSKYYYIYQKDERGGFFEVHLRNDNCYIFQDENKQPYVFSQNITYTPSKWIFIWPKLTYKEKTKIDIHVPTNTIILEYKVE